MSRSLTTGTPSATEPSENGNNRTPSSTTSSGFSSQRASTPSPESSQVHGQADLSQSNGSENAVADDTGSNGTGGDAAPNTLQLDRFLGENMSEEGNLHGRLLQSPSASTPDDTADDDALAEFFDARDADALRLDAHLN